MTQAELLWPLEWRLAGWGGFSATLTGKEASLNGQLAYEEDGTLAAALSVEYAVVPGLMVQPEINYTDFGGERGSGEAFGGILRVQRNF